jgi:hypothetical protein
MQGAGIWMLTAAAVMTAALAGCAQDRQTREQPAAYGFEWAGQGEPTNFGADYGRCRRLVDNTETARSDPFVPSGVQRSRTDPFNKRQFFSCMQGAGWRQARGG